MAHVAHAFITDACGETRNHPQSHTQLQVTESFSQQPKVQKEAWIKKTHFKLHTERPHAWELNLQPMWLWFFSVNNCNVLFNIRQSALALAFKLQPSPDSSNGSWRLPQHKRPPLNWCIVFQVITHYSSDSFCWSRSWRIRHGGLEVTQSAELLFKAFMMFTWSPIRNWLHWGKNKHKKIQPCIFFRHFHDDSLVRCSDIQLSSSILISPREKNNSDGAKQKSAWCPESIVCYKSESSCGWNIDFQ